MEDLPIRREELYRMYDGSTESILEVFDAFLETEREVLEELTIAFSNENGKLICQQLHYHAPVFGYIGFSPVTLIFKALENKYKNPVGIAEMEQDYTDLVQILQHVTSTLLLEKELMRTAVHA
jgi:hypothetical protein